MIDHLTGGELAQIIIALATLITASGGVVMGVINARRIKDVHESTNGKMDQLLDVSRFRAEARGSLETQTDRPPMEGR